MRVVLGGFEEADVVDHYCCCYCCLTREMNYRGIFLRIDGKLEMGGWSKREVFVASSS